ncbi:MAG: hypothetical protein QOJ68_622 [Blastococcus sp.]|jgi:hypothetical protein|nr:hypothetical protein [Blastococcus sp.]
MGPSWIEGITRISTTRGNAVSQGTSSRSSAHRSVSLGVVAGLLVLVAGAALAAAGPAAAAEDTSRPVVRIVKGPSCSPGGMVIDVVARTTAYSVRLATTRTPAGEDSGTVQPGATLRLHGADVAYGETVDSRLEYTAVDGSGTSYVDELEDWTMTRPSKVDCDAVAAQPSADSSAGVAPSSPAATSSTAAAAGSTGGGQSSAASQAAAAASDWNAGSAAVTGIDSAGAYTLAGSGFQPGERVTVHLRGSGTVLASATAAPDGSVHARVQLPASDGAQSVDLVGDRSEVTAGVRLQAAAAQTPVEPRGAGNLWALIAACVALVGTVGGLVSVLGSRRSAPRFRSA